MRATSEPNRSSRHAATSTNASGTVSVNTGVSVGGISVAVGLGVGAGVKAVVGATCVVGSTDEFESPPPQAAKADNPINKTITLRYIVFFHSAYGSIL